MALFWNKMDEQTSERFNVYILVLARLAALCHVGKVNFASRDSIEMHMRNSCRRPPFLSGKSLEGGRFFTM